ncbi:MAG: DUF2877 domain-containing protein [Chloroflexi bacterium]|nr:DUF2877 domain-containing protein [Chloroflexota bacterium]MDA1271939.1 DUF2877 domain-containing protein [Chloroflexota bacterium]
MAPRPTVKLIGTKAYRYLSAPGFSGEVISAGTRAVYIATSNGDILAACRPDQQPHPRSFLTDLDLSGFRAGLHMWVEGAELRCGNGVCFDLTDAQVWSRRTPDYSAAVTIQQLGLRCEESLRAAIKLYQGDNLGLALPFLDTGANADSSALLPDIPSPLIAAGVEQIERMLPFCRSGNLGAVLEMADRMIGLGPGLTPSGDDFVGGLVFMALHLTSAYPVEQWWEGGDIPALLQRSEGMTSQISRALLTDLSEGQSHASLHDLADSLLSDAEGFDAETHVSRVSKIGHSSGWDMLTGMLAGLLPVMHRSRASRS